MIRGFCSAGGEEPLDRAGYNGTMNQQQRRIPNKRKLLYSAIIVMLPLLAVEVALRIVYSRIERITGVGQFRKAEFGGLTYHWDRYHPRYGWTNVPGYRSDDQIPFQVTINQQGLRAATEYSIRPEPGVYRIAVLGDSCTFGEEVHDNETVPYYLERHLSGSEVLNFGIHGFGIGQMGMRLEDEVFAFSPHHVLVNVMIHEDVLRATSDQFVYNKPVFSLLDSRLQIANVPVPEASQQLWLYRNCFTASWLFARPKQKLPATGQPVEVATAILKRMQQRCSDQGVRLTVLLFVSPHVLKLMKQNEKWRRFNYNMARSLQRLDMDVLDEVVNLENLYSQNPTSKLSMPAGHWSPTGNRFIALRLAKHLVTLDKRITLRPKGKR